MKPSLPIVLSVNGGYVDTAGFLALLVVYVWATTAFGIRFSNLTHRGIFANGPYA